MNKWSSVFGQHPGQENKDGSPPFASQAKQNFSTNESRSGLASEDKKAGLFQRMINAFRKITNH